MSDALKDPIHASGQLPRVAVIWNSDRYELTTKGNWVDLPGAVIPAQVGQGTPSLGGLFVATFTAETLIGGQPSTGSLDITFGGQDGHPQSNNHRYATAQSSEEWGSLTTIRAFEYPPEATVRDATIKVKVHLGSGTVFGFQNWLLKVERYPYEGGGF
ncbi:hypothetical protein [Streptomyces sp. NPDC017991]|uniref:hypothetical protein n=1 Tax=Streptomyces sp. NPDC017991 TaxID=3365026 RepID=UPI00378AE442